MTTSTDLCMPYPEVAEDEERTERLNQQAAIEALKHYPGAVLRELARQRDYYLDHRPLANGGAFERDYHIPFLARVLPTEAEALWDMGVGPAGTAQGDNEPDSAYRARYWLSHVAALADDAYGLSDAL